jgi:hypothetical protein
VLVTVRGLISSGYDSAVNAIPEEVVEEDEEGAGDGTAQRPALVVTDSAGM